jgi:putative transposase
MGEPSKRRRPEQIVRLLQEASAWLAAGQSVGEVCQRLGVSLRTYQLWRQRYGELQVDEAKRLGRLEQENARLKRLLAEAELDKAILKEALQGNW